MSTPEGGRGNAMRVVSFVLVVLCALALPVAARAAHHNCAPGTGLDPTCPQTQVTAAQSITSLTPTATMHTDTVSGAFAWDGDRQISLTLPLYQHLRITGIGDAYGMGDIGISYVRVFTGKGRLAQAAGVSAVGATGSDSLSSTGHNALGALYALSYSVGNRITLLGIASYAFDTGVSKIRFAPDIQTLTLTPRAIVNLTRAGAYAAFDAPISQVTGGERYDAYTVNGYLGFARGRYDAYVTYGVPLDSYTRAHVFTRSTGFVLSFRP